MRTEDWEHGAEGKAQRAESGEQKVRR